MNQKAEKLLLLFRKNHLLNFSFRAILLYSSWFLLYYLVIEPKTFVDEVFITSIIKVSEKILNSIGYLTFIETEDHTFQLIGIVGGIGNPGVWVGTGCNALTLFSLFTIFIVSFPGNIKDKLWFIPLGILIIHLSNLARVCSLALIAYYNYNLLNFNHTYTFTILVYGIIFLLWIWWVKKFSKLSE